MTFDEKALLAVYDLLSMNKPVTKRSLARRIGVDRSSVYNRLRTHNRLIDVEMVEPANSSENLNV